MSQFSSNEAVSLEKGVDSTQKPVVTNLENLEKVYEISRCLSWIQTNNFQKVCLQFPDHLLADSSRVALELQRKLKQTVYVLADTAYESCCIDYVAAAHVKADALVHFGPICFSETSHDIPHLYVYEKKLLEVEKFRACYAKIFADADPKPVILLDSDYVHLTNEISSSCPDNTVKTIDEHKLTDAAVLLIGTNARKLPNLKFRHKPKSLYFYNPDFDTLTDYEDDERIARRRYYLVEKIKDSTTVGIVIGTLAVQNYLKLIERLKKLLSLHGKKYYLISVGKPTVAKLANFSEIDIYVMITCALNEIHADRDYYKPIVTPFDVELALNSRAENFDFSYDFNTFVSNPIGEVSRNNDVSLISGNLRRGVTSDEEENDGDGGDAGRDVAVRNCGTVDAYGGGGGAAFLATRSWKGLEQRLGETEVKTAEEGRRGIAQGYSEEMTHN